jgi:hypothetical protein
MLKRIAPPIHQAKHNSAAITHGEECPTILANRGALIRNPLPMMEASGVTVADQASLLQNCGKNERHRNKTAASKTMRIFMRSW